MRILLVEDDAKTAAYVARGLRESGTILAAPTYIFLATTLGLIALGLLQTILGVLLSMKHEVRVMQGQDISQLPIFEVHELIGTISGAR